ncbi:VanZ family protein [Acetobacterium bakii]|uniref:VanZ-like domain-containing protein n=1 Tax=Acetobacterium bakii TaxID=52689 RepID=A0A0L6U1X8_9FIRM|nr:VanZ family protein [Acetobacterium bakii]KNZ42518.1 hypothetical protein AKG39_06240 [Acetobacterium bakii]
MEKINKRRILWSVVMLWMLVIFFFSAQPALESARLSGGITEMIVTGVVSNFNYLSADEQHIIIQQASFAVRKSAHFSIYAILGFFTMLALYKTAQVAGFIKLQKKQTQGFLALLICMLYAMSDEFHQHFVLGRSAELRDVLIDITGAALGILIAWLILNIRQRFMNNKLNVT